MTALNQLFLLLILFQFKHFVADGPLQTKAMVDEKSRYGATLGIVHAGIHGILTIVVVMLVLHGWVWAVVLGLIDFAIHYHVDYVKERLVKYWGFTPADGPFWWALSADQMMHHLTYIGLAALAAAA
ncbi:DUF3307 domain-containing protein [Aestuariivirga litoralis]|uniref:DUF3307 domain-containing protein n=1 Tax=Aestuariivirga litoralis TaxID=2650924 RepID=UPI0018C5B400|nr:DUF3307 domain-containing protein [Aestuariivirga litoralis]MBG1231283.1 DUF3307 domain-containing protein [Aestuariivirga litoralis]